MTIEEFVKVLKRLLIAYNKEFSNDQVNVWYDNFKNISYENCKQAVKSIITKNKFMPSIAELLDECKSVSKTNIELILEKMQQDGYFKDSMELEKVYMWLEKGLIPSWLKEDMKAYGYQENLEISNKNIKLLEE